MAEAITPENAWSRIVHYRRLAAEYDARAKRESDPEIRGDLFKAVVQLIALADKTTAAPAEPDASDDGETAPPRLFYCRPSQTRAPVITRPAPKMVSRTKHYSPAGSLKSLKVRSSSRTTPHPARGILSRCPA